MKDVKTLSAALVIAATAAAIGFSSGSSAVTAPDAGTGTGEELILVVAGQDTEQTVTRLARKLGRRLSELQGFYVARAADFAVTGVHVQMSADVVAVPCAAIEVDCPPGSPLARLLQPVDLRFVPASAFSSFRFPAPCGADLVPCQRQTIERMLGRSLSFRPEAHLALTAFRTQAGAESFLELTRAAGIADLVTVSARKLGGGDVGLGQEPHPDGSGPLLHPLPDQTRYQR